MILRAKFHVVSSLLSVLKMAILMTYECPCTPLKMSLPKNETTVNLKSAYFVVILLVHKGLTCIHSQKKPRLHFGESFALNDEDMDTAVTGFKFPFLFLCTDLLSGQPMRDVISLTCSPPIQHAQLAKSCRQKLTCANCNTDSHNIG